jgi:hypothetical protein
MSALRASGTALPGGGSGRGHGAGVRAQFVAASALFWVIGGASGCSEETASGSGLSVSSARPSATASAAVAASVPDTSPPSFLPSGGYTELPWPDAMEVIQRRAVDRVIRTQTRRAYVVKRNGDKHFTIEPVHGALRAVIREADDNSFLHYEKHEIPWEEAEAHLRSGRAQGVSVLHFRIVEVTLDHRSVFAILPEGKSVRQILDEAKSTLEVTIE